MPLTCVRTVYSPQEFFTFLDFKRTGKNYAYVNGCFGHFVTANACYLHNPDKHHPVQQACVSLKFTATAAENMYNNADSVNQRITEHNIKLEVMLLLTNKALGIVDVVVCD